MVRISLFRQKTLGYFFGLMFAAVSVALFFAKGDSEHFTRLIAMLSLAVAVVLLCIRHYVEIDTEARVLSRRFGVFYGFRLRRFDFDRVQRIALTDEVRRTYSRKDGSSKKKVVYVLRINGDGGDHFCELSDLWEARLLAEQICRAMSVGLQNRLLGGSSTRKADELDLSLAERWRRAGEHKEAPKLPAGSSLLIEHSENYSELSSPVEPFPRVRTAVIGAAVLTALIAIFYFVGAEFLFILLIFGAATLFGSLSLILQHSGRNRVRFTADSVTFLRGKFSRRSIALARIEELLANDNELVLMSDDTYLTVDKPRGDAEALILRQFVERQIAQRQT